MSRTEQWLALATGCVCGALLAIAGISPLSAWKSTQSFITENGIYSSSHSPSSVENTESKNKLQELIFLGSHPQDQQRPSTVAGKSDDELLSIPPNELDAALQAGLEHARASADPATLFAAGRVAWALGDAPTAKELLENAAQNGSAAALGYLGRLYEDPEEAIQALQSSVSGGFAPAQDWLEELEDALLVSSEPDFSIFSKPELMRALYEGDFERLNQQQLVSSLYTAGIATALADPQILFLLQDHASYLASIDAKLPIQAQIKMMTNPVAQRELLNEAGAMFMNLLQGYGQAMQQNDLGNMMASLYGGLVDPQGRTIDLLAIQSSMKKDGTSLALMYDTDPEAFQQIYANLRTFVLAQP